MQLLNFVYQSIPADQGTVPVIPSHSQYHHTLQYRGQTYRPSVPLRVYSSTQVGCYRGQPMTFNTPVRHIQDGAAANLCYRGQAYVAQLNLA